MTTLPASTIPNRPLGVWILCAYAFLVEGLIPASAMALFTVAGLRAPASAEATNLLTLVVARLLISLGITAASIAAFLGKKAGLWSMVSLITVSHVLAVQNLPILFVGSLPSSLLPTFVLGALKQAIAPIIYVWYFTRQQARSFYAPPRVAQAGD